MAICDEDLIDCWHDALTEPEIVEELGLRSTKELRLHWRRLKESGKLPLSSRGWVDGKVDRGSSPALDERDLLLERLIRIHGEPRNDQFKCGK